jgi:hypothetical protein
MYYYLLEAQSKTYVKCRSKNVKTWEMCEIESFIREQITKFELKEIYKTIIKKINKK